MVGSLLRRGGYGSGSSCLFQRLVCDCHDRHDNTREMISRICLPNQDKFVADMVGNLVERRGYRPSLLRLLHRHNKNGTHEMQEKSPYNQPTYTSYLRSQSFHQSTHPAPPSKQCNYPIDKTNRTKFSSRRFYSHSLRVPCKSFHSF
jgi:hypothetical protein